MTIRSNAAILRLFCSGLISLSFLLIPISALATPAPTFPPKGSASLEPQIVARPAPHRARSDRPWTTDQEDELSGHVAEARRVLMELRAFVNEAAEAMVMGDRLKARRKDNDRLREALARSLAAKDAFEGHLGPTEIVLSTLTRTVVRNWLETVRLNHRSDDVDRNLDASKQSRSILESRGATLERTLVERRAELLTLRSKKAALVTHLGQMRRQIAERQAETRRLEMQRRQILTVEESLRRHMTLRLRAVLLGNQIP